MGRFKADEADNYGGQGGTGYFSLKNDKDVAQVRFMYDGIEDVEGIAVHKVEVNGKKRYVNCLRSYNDPMDMCPMCREKYFQIAKLFIPVYNIEEDRIQIWERGKKFFQKMSSLCSRYPNLVSHVFEIERNGKAGSTQTTYEIYDVDKDDTTLEDLPELPEIIGSLVLDKSADDMEYYIEQGEFPPEDDEPVRHRGSKSNKSEDVEMKDDEEEQRPHRARTDNNRRSGSNSRRTPARRGDKF